MDTDLRQDLSESNLIFIHSELDDLGLSVHAFRICGHLARRAGKHAKSAWPSIASMARVCRMHEDSVSRALTELIHRKVIVRETRKGRSSLYILTPPSLWNKVQEMSQECSSTPPKIGDTRKEGVPPKVGYHPPESKGYHPPENEGYEGNPKKVIQEGLPGGSGDPPAVEPDDDVPQPREQPAEKKARRRNVAFDALAELDGAGNTLTASAAGRVGKALAEIRAAWPIKLPDKPKDAERDAYEARLAQEIRVRVREYRAIFPGAAATSTALAVHWGRCATKQSPVSADAPAVGRYPLPAGCEWRAIARRIGVRIDFDTPWSEVGFEARRRILEAHAQEGLIS